MQSIVQARRKSNRVPARRQASRRSVSFTPATCDQGSLLVSLSGYCLGLHNQADDAGFVAGVEISPEQFKALQLAARRAGKSLSDLLAHACDLLVSPSLPQTTSVTTDQLAHMVKLEESISAAGSALVLMAEKTADYRQQLGINDDDDGLSSGLLNLAEQTGTRLKADFQSAFTGIAKLNGEVKP